MPETARDVALGQILWDYLSVQQPIEPADVIVAGGSCDLAVPKEAARLFSVCSAQWLIISGGMHEKLGEHEVDAYERVVLESGNVPPGSIIKDYDAHNTGDHIKFAQRALLGKVVIPYTVALVHTPIMPRRCLATAEKQWEAPQPRFISRREDVTFDAYRQRPLMEDTFSRMLGCVWRMQEHYEKGYQTKQDVPPEVQAACAALVERGHIVRGLHK